MNRKSFDLFANKVLKKRAFRKCFPSRTEKIFTLSRSSG